MTHSSERLSIGIALFDGAEELDWAGPWEVLAYWSKFKPDDNVQVFTVARDNSRPIECGKGLRVLADHSWDSAPEIDVLVYPGPRDYLGVHRRVGSGRRRIAQGPAGNDSLGRLR
jgi:transcriptional regulator GlxA family with amidase domain